MKKEEHASEPSAPHLSRRAVLGRLAAASVFPWLAGSAQSAGAADLPGRNSPRTSPLPRRDHTATSLGGGYVLVAGGFYQGVLADVQIHGPYDFVTTAAPLLTPRYGHVAVALSDGRIVVLGGYGLGPLDAVESYDPRTDRWTPLKALRLPRYQHAAARLTDSRILLTGGYFQAILSDTEVYVL